MNQQEALAKVRHWREQVAASQRKLHELRKAAMVGQYDADQFDAEVRRYRVAEKQLTTALRYYALAIKGTCFDPANVDDDVKQEITNLRALKARIQAGEFADDLAPSEPEPQPAPSPYLLYGKWLYDTGRIDEWNTRRESILHDHPVGH